MSALVLPSGCAENDCRVRRVRFGKAARAFLLGVVLLPGLEFARVDAGGVDAVMDALRAERDGPVAVVSLATVRIGDDNTPNPAHENPTAAAVQASLEVEACDENGGWQIAGFQSLRAQVASLRDERVREIAERAQIVIVGTASTYNPYLENTEAEYFETASGELYDPADWTAAIQIDLRRYFGGVRYGRNYQPNYALVESGGKQIIVKINDVGPLRPGRAIDLNDRSMRYFDPSMQLGLVHDMKITLLPGDDWMAGPVGAPRPVSIASVE